ncbi:MAG: hypothetical protein Q9184_000891 [Pyrenodesmia sp. 2 TL-2023]
MDELELSPVIFLYRSTTFIAMTETMVAPASGEALTAFAFDSDFSSTFQPDIPTQRPRPWDRLPKSPHTEKRKGRKVWKRYEALQRNVARENQRQNEQRELEKRELNGSVDTAHTAKRLRSREATTEQESVMGQKASRYVTTLRDKALGTPRRKLASRRSLRLDRPKVAKPSFLGSVNPTDDETVTGQLADEAVELETLVEEEVREVFSDPVQPSEGPSSEDVAEALSSPMPERLVHEDMFCNEGPEMVYEGILHDKAAGAAAPLEDDKVISHSAIIDSTGPATPTRELRSTTPGNTSPTSDLATTQMSARNPMAIMREASAIETSAVEVQAKSEPPTPQITETSKPQNKPSTDAISPEQENEDVVTSLPKRSEVREQEPRRSSSRLSEKNRNSATDEETQARPASADTLMVEITDNVAEVAEHLATNESESASKTDSPQNEDHPELQALDIESQEAQEGMIDIGSTASGSEFLQSVEIEEATMQKVEEVVPSASATELDHNKPKTAPTESTIGKSPRKSTRSRARFSDDTSMLKDFLSRAQARKQAKDAVLAAEALTAARSPFPRSSPRKALASLDSNSPSAEKICEVASRVRTPPGKVKLGEIQIEGMDETVMTTSPVRRSTRKRLPELAKTATGAPSFIPVRRADGTDPVVLPKSVAQELALVTRTNTRRNKGQAKPPAIILKTLNVDEVEEETKGGHALRSCKSVGWDDKLVYYHDGTQIQADAEVEVEEKRPKARRLRGLGAGNGTPAPKRQTAEVLSTNVDSEQSEDAGKSGVTCS